MKEAEERVPLIAHIIFRLNIGGLENGLVNLINHMPENRYRHAILCLQDYSDFRFRLRRKDVRLFALHKRRGKNIGVYFKLWWLLCKLRPDLTTYQFVYNHGIRAFQQTSYNGKSST
jgi:hypothetical protein